MSQFRRLYFEDVPHVRDIDKERRENGLFRAKQRKIIVIFFVTKNKVEGFLSLIIKNLALNSELSSLTF
jgi:hypothetical protein